MAKLNRERLLIGLSLLCLGALAADHLILTPMIEHWKARTERIAELEQDLEKGKLLLDREGVLQARWREMHERSLPTNEAEAENAVLSALSDWAREGGLNITDLKPRWLSEKGQPQRLEVRLSATGRLGALSRFLYALEQSPQALRLEQVSMRTRDTKGKELTLEARFSGLVLAEEKR